jgi:prepilin-type N-terminal cleavage/methylation domain-containing protein
MEFVEKKKRGFTLIELIMTVIVIGVLASVLIQRLGAYRASTIWARNNANVAVLNLVIEKYTLEGNSFVLTPGTPPYYAVSITSIRDQLVASGYLDANAAISSNEITAQLIGGTGGSGTIVLSPTEDY